MKNISNIHRSNIGLMSYLHRTIIERATPIRGTTPLLILFLIILGISNVWAADETLTITGAATGNNAPWSTSYSNGSGTSTTSASSSINISWTQVATMSNTIQIKNTNGAGFYSTSAPSTNNIIKSINITGKTNINSIVLSCSKDGTTWTEVSFSSGTAKDVSSSEYKYFKVTKDGAYVQLTSIVVTYTTSSGGSGSGGGGCNTGEISVTLSRNGTASTTCETKPYTLPSTEPDACSGWVFDGWSATKVDDVSTQPTYVSGNVTTTTSLFAIYKNEAGVTRYSATPECSAVGSSAEVEIAEWFQDSIHINIPEGAVGSVVIENKNENSTIATHIATDIFFSKYFEAARSTKLLGLYNGTDHDIDISDLRIRGGKDSWSAEKGENNFVQLSDVTRLKTKYGTTGGKIMLPPGKEIILYSMASGDRSYYVGATCMDQYVDWDELAEDEKDDWYRIGTTSGGIDGDGHKTINFSGAYSVSLERKTGTNYYTMIDLIGAGSFSTPDKSSAGKVSGTQYLGDGTVITAANDDDGFYCMDGMSPPAEGYPDGYSVYLSTNLCLLIRKSTVSSGENAVNSNTNNFETLCDEWVGVPIGKQADSNARSCRSGNQFGYVGSFDYNEYFAQYTEVGKADNFDSDHRNPDGTYTVKIEQLDTLACTTLKLSVYDNSNAPMATNYYKVPIMVKDGKQTTSEIFHNYDKTPAICKECDVVVLRNATLTKATDGASGDVTEIRDLMIYPGGKLEIPATGGTYKVRNIQFRVEGDSIPPYAVLDGNLTTSTSKLLVSRRINNKRYYFFSLPYACMVNDIRWSNGETPVIGTDYKILQYDGATRANTGKLDAWTEVTAGSILQAGVGYVIAVSSSVVKELVFPMNIGSDNLSNAEKNKTTNSVSISKYENSATTIENHNWNLIAHPYVARFAPYEGDNIKAGYLEWNGTEWERKNTGSVYLTIPDYKKEGRITANDYTQTLVGDVSGSMDPFLAVFVQAAGDGNLTFSQSKRRASAPARHLAAKSEYEDESIFVGVTLSGNGKSDQTNLRIRPDFTEDYQLGYDLVKFSTKHEAKPCVYMQRSADKLAFQAVSDENAAKMLPMGVYLRNAGTYTFALSADYPHDQVEAVYLYDAETGLTTNLLNNAYSFTVNTTLETSNRFSLSAIVRRPVPSVATGCEQVDTDSPMTRKVLINGHVYIQRDGKLFDITGKQMLNH